MQKYNSIDKEVETPWLSIVIPIYNAEKYLSVCLDSILNQSYTNFEVILVDDGSRDSSSDICLKYSEKDKRIRYFKKENGGSYQTRIYGAERASGTYITFCDADDFYINKNVFYKIYCELKKENFSVLQFGHYKKFNHLKHRISSISSAVNIDKDDFLINEYPKLLGGFWNESHLTNSVWNKVYHSKLFSNVPSSDSVERFFWGDDRILNLYLLENCESYRIITDALYCYRIGGGTTKFSTDTMKDVDKIKKYQLIFLERYCGNAKGKIKEILFSELAGWFFYYIQSALDHTSEDELKSIINDALLLPRFIVAREYFSKEKSDSIAINLLCMANAERYIECAKEQHNKTFKKRVLDLLKLIYASI